MPATLVADATIPRAIVEAPKRRKHPRPTVNPRLIGIRPLSINIPVAATAITAIAVVAWPRANPSNHCAAPSRALLSPVADGTAVVMPIA